MFSDSSEEKMLDEILDNVASSDYSADLAYISASFAKAAYSVSEAENLYETYGFNNAEAYDYNEDYSLDSCGYFIATKESSENSDLICLVAIRGSKSKSDWISDFIILTDSDGNHIGFSTAADKIYSKIKETVISRHPLRKVKFIITGHSRAAAVGNLVSVKMMKNGYSSGKIYNYNFACPDVACRYFSFNIYRNIFNLCNREDVVPLLPGPLCSAFADKGKSWCKFGITLRFTAGTDSIIEAHKMENYLAFFEKRLAYEDWGTSTADVISDIAYSAAWVICKILCPVDVVITDEDGNKVASVINGEINYYDSSFGEVIIMTDGEHKVICVNSDKKYKVLATGTDEGEMTYSVEKGTLSGETLYSKTYKHVDLSDNKEMVSYIEDEFELAAVPLYVVENGTDGEKIEKTINTNGKEYTYEEQHNYKETFRKEPGNGEDGYVIYTCTHCKETKGETISDNGNSSTQSGTGAGTVTSFGKKSDIKLIAIIAAAVLGTAAVIVIIILVVKMKKKKPSASGDNSDLTTPQDYPPPSIPSQKKNDIAPPMLVTKPRSRFCGNCGARMTPGCTFCGMCGTKM